MALTLALQIFALLALALMGPAVVLTREPTRQAIAISFYGLTLAAAFFLFEAPDVALSQIVIGAVAEPLMLMLALTKVRHREAQQKSNEEASP